MNYTICSRLFPHSQCWLQEDFHIFFLWLELRKICNIKRKIAVVIAEDWGPFGPPVLCNDILGSWCQNLHYNAPKLQRTEGAQRAPSVLCNDILQFFVLYLLFYWIPIGIPETSTKIFMFFATFPEEICEISHISSGNVAKNWISLTYNHTKNVYNFEKARIIMLFAINTHLYQYQF